jgi:hypothetical protein
MIDEKPDMRNPSKFYGSHFDKQNCLTMSDLRKIARASGCLFPITAATYLCKIPDCEPDILKAEIKNTLDALRRNRKEWWRKS